MCDVVAGFPWTAKLLARGCGFPSQNVADGFTYSEFCEYSSDSLNVNRICEFTFYYFLLKSPRFILRILLYANLANVIKIRVTHPALTVFLSTSDEMHTMSCPPVFFPRFQRMFSKLAVAVLCAWPSLTLLIYNGLLFIIFGDGNALAKAKEGQREDFK